MKKMLLLLGLLFLPSLAAGSTLTITHSPELIGDGDLVEVTVSVASEIPINAFSGTLTCTASLTAESVDDGNSIVNVWITRPSISENGIAFAGITPGGFAGSSGKILSARYRAQGSGLATCTMQEIKMLRNDGAGTREPVETRPLSLAIAPESRGSFEAGKDTEPPEHFQIYRHVEPELYEGKPYLTFAAIDKQSGIDHYEAAESRLSCAFKEPSWEIVGTTYVPKDSHGTSAVCIKAVDRAGNERIEVYPRGHLVHPVEAWALGILIILLALYIWRRRRA